MTVLVVGSGVIGEFTFHNMPLTEGAPIPVVASLFYIVDFGY